MTHIMVGRIKLSAPNTSLHTSPHTSPITTLGRFCFSIHCSTMITTYYAVIAMSLRSVENGSTFPSRAPMPEPMIQ